MSDLWWMHAVILGAAFALVAQAMAESIKNWRTHPGSRMFVTGLIWQIFLLLLILEVWVAFSYYQRTVTQLSVISMVAFLAVPVAIFIMSVLLQGNFSRVDHDAAEGEVFDRVRPVFFGTLIALIVVNVLHEAVLGNAGFDSDLLFQMLLLAGGLVGLVIKGRPADTWLGVVMIGIISAYILIDYAVLKVPAPM